MLQPAAGAMESKRDLDDTWNLETKAAATRVSCHTCERTLESSSSLQWHYDGLLHCLVQHCQGIVQGAFGLGQGRGRGPSLGCFVSSPKSHLTSSKTCVELPRSLSVEFTSAAP